MTKCALLKKTVHITCMKKIVSTIQAYVNSIYDLVQKHQPSCFLFSIKETETDIVNLQSRSRSLMVTHNGKIDVYFLNHDR